MPISFGKEKIGVLVVQHEQKNYFNQNDVMALRAIASQLAGTVANARLMMTSHRLSDATDRTVLLEKLRFVKAEATVHGFALAPAAILHPFNPLKGDVPDDAFKSTLNDFQQAVQKTRNNSRNFRINWSNNCPKAHLF